MENRRDEHVIYIKDLLFAVLYQWRKILICALVLALVLGGYRGFSVRNAVLNASNSDVSQAQEAYQQQKELLELEINRLESRIQSYSAFITDSPFMDLNPHSVYVGTMSIYVKSNETRLADKDAFEDAETDTADALLQAYRAILLQNDTMQTVSNALFAESKNLETLIDVNCDMNSNLMTILTRQTDLDNANLALDLMTAALEDAKSDITAAIGQHSVTVISRSIALRNDSDLAAKQDDVSAKLLKLKDNLAAKQTDLKNLTVPTIQPASGKDMITSALKYAILGAFLGAFAVAAVVCLAHLARSKVYSARTLTDHTGLYVLGCIPSGSIRCPLDRSLRKLERRCIQDPQGQSALVAARIYNVCSADAKLLIAGSCPAAFRLPLLQALENAGINITASGDLLQDADAVAALASCDGVVLVEQCGQSRYEQILQTVEQVTAMGKSVIGCVLIDG